MYNWTSIEERTIARDNHQKNKKTLEVLGFLETFQARIGLVHYKTTQGGVVQPVIGPGDMDHQRLFSRLYKVYTGIFCLEIPGKADVSSTWADLVCSLKFMEGEGLLQYFS